MGQFPLGGLCVFNGLSQILDKRRWCQASVSAGTIVKTLHKGGEIMWFQKVCKLAAIITVSSLLIFTGIAVAKDFDIDKNSILKGTYLYSGNIYCVSAFPPGGFYPNLKLINGGSTSSMIIQGEFIFNGDGTGSRSVDWLLILNSNLGSNERPLNYGTSYADFTYTVNMDGTFEMTSGEATVDKEFGVPHTQTIDGFGTSTGAIAAGQKTFTLADTNPTIETITRGSVEIERICNRTGIGIKIK
jgi:hypothetical protein